MIMLFLKGIMLGLLISAPVGPVGIICMQRTLRKGRISGFISGLGAALADTFYASVAAFSIVIISDFLREHQTALRIVGIMFLLYLGSGLFFKEPDKMSEEKGPEPSLTRDFFSALILTLTNPVTIFTFTLLFAGIGFSANGFGLAAWLVAGVFVGASAWWLILSLAIGYFRDRLKDAILKRINLFSAVLTLAFAAFILIETLSK